jgi:ABC-type sugar transport system ATPase subunit
MDQNTLLEFQNVNKTFSGVPALRNVSFCVKKGEIHALLGENGAGKSTLMKILSGAYTKDSGEIIFERQKYKFKDTNESEKVGISIIYQELNMIPELSVAENIFIHRQPERKSGFIDWRKMRRDASDVLSKVGLDVNPSALVRTLSVAQQQMVEISKALTKNLKLLVMDEPTSSLSDSETKNLFEVIRSLQKRGVTVIYISHRMEEIFELCDSYTVMRDGEVIVSGRIQDTTIDNIIRSMVGREMNQVFPKHEFKIGGKHTEGRASFKWCRGKGCFI